LSIFFVSSTTQVSHIILGDSAGEIYSLPPPSFLFHICLRFVMTVVLNLIRN